MPVTVQHSKTATTPDVTTAEIRPSHWNEPHVVSLSLASNEVIKYIGASGSSRSSGTISFSNSNGISFGMSNGTITASHNGLTIQSVQTQGIQSVIAGGNTISGGGVVFSNANNVSFGIAGSTVTASASAAAQSNQSIGLYASSQTTGAASSTTVDARSLTVVGAGGVSVGMSAGRLVVSGASGGAADGFNRLAAGTQTAGTNTTVQFADSNGITFGMSGSNQITASHDGLRSHLISAPNGSSSVAGVSFANSNGVSWSNSNGSIVASVATGGGVNTVTQYAVGNTAGDSSSNTQPLSSWQLRGAGVASVGYSADGAVIISVPAGGGGGDGGNVLAAGTQTATTLGTVAFADSNGITFGMSGSTRITASHNGLTSQSNQALSAPNGSFAFQTAQFHNSNGVSWSTTTGSGIVASVAAQSNQSVGIYGSSQTTGQSSSSTVDARSLTLRGAGIVSVGLSAGEVIISATGGGGGVTPVVSANNGSYSFTTLSFSNANGVSFGTSAGSAVTASIAAQSNQTVGLYASSNTAGESSSSTIDARSLTVRGIGAISAGLSAGELILSVAAGAQSNQTGAIYALGNTTGQSSSSTFDARTLSIEGAGIISGGWSNGSFRISATQSNQAFSAEGGSSAFQTLIFTNSNGVSFSNTNGSVWASVAAQSAQTVGVYGSSNTTGQSSSSTVDARSLSFRGVGAISVGMSAGEVILSAAAGAQSNQTGAIYAVGNTTGQSSSSTFDARTLSIDGGGIVSVGWSNSTLRVSATQSNQAFSAQGGSSAFQTLIFTNSNGVSFSNTNGSIWGSVAAQTNQTIGVYATSNTTGQSSSSTYDARSLTIRGYGVISVGNSNGSILLSTPDPVDFTQLSVGNSNLGNTAGDTGVFTGRMVLVGSNNITLSGSSNGGSQTISIIGGAGGGFSAGLSNIGNTAGDTGVTGTRLVLAGGNNITLSGSTNANGGTITVSAFNQSNQSIGIYASSNTTAQSSSSTVDARSLSFRGVGAISVGMSAGEVILSAAAGAQSNQTLGLYATGNTTQNSSTTFDARTLGTMNGLGAMTVGFSNGSIQLSAPATSSLSATGLVSISADGATISIGVAGNTASFWNPFDDPQTTAVQIGNGSVMVQPAFNLHGVVSLSRFDVLASMSFSTSTNSSHAGALSFYVGMYTRNGSTLSLASSGSQSYQWTNTSSNSMNSISGLRRYSVPVNVLVTNGPDIWVAMLSRSSTTNANWFSASNARVSVFTSPVQGLIGETIVNTMQLAPGLGLWTTTSTALPASIAISDIRGIGASAANNALPFFINGCNLTA